MFKIGRFVPGPLRQVERAVRKAVGVRIHSPLPAADCVAELGTSITVLKVEAGGRVDVSVRVRNLGSRAWASVGSHPVTIAARWLNGWREPAVGSGPQSLPLPGVVYPGECLDAVLTAVGPVSLGHHFLELLPAQAGGPSFLNAGTRPLQIPARVTGRAEADIDYHRQYAAADFARDYWTVAGPSSKAEYDRLAIVKRDLLTAHGLTPDARVLDIGCGTGQLPQALDPYLSDRGFYLGLDVGAEGIAFCETRFRRPNFRFAVSEPTSVPVREGGFDIACFFSVFTHTYPDETALLLAEAERLLAPGGWVMADVFVTPFVDRFAGNRGAIELNRAHFLRLAALAGFRHAAMVLEVYQTNGANREFYKLTRSA